MRAFVEKRTHTARFLPGDAIKQPQHEGWMRASWGGAAVAARAVAAGDGAAEGGVRVTARGAGGEHSPPWSIGDSSLAQMGWSLQGRLQ